MDTGEFLVDHRRGEERFRIRGRFATGTDHQIALVEDTQNDDRFCCARVVMYDPERADDEAYVEQRRDLLRTQRELLERGYDGLPEFVDWVEVESDDGVEPVLIYEYVHGTHLYEYVTHEEPNGMDPAPATVTLRKVAEVVAELHEDGWIWRNFDPRHVIVDDEGDFVGLVGFGNAAPTEDHEPNPTLLEAYTDAAYVAPEVRNERSGQTWRPEADIYGLGALFSFMLSQKEPTTRVESPLTGPAYDRLMELEPPGVGLLVAMCLQPTAKHRLQELSTLLTYTMPGRLPDPEEADMERADMPEPWSGAEPPSQGRTLESKLSAGPLISVPRDGEVESGPAGGSPSGASGRAAQPPGQGFDEKAFDADTFDGEAFDGEEFDGVRSAPVEEFLGETDAEGGETDESEVATDEAGEPVREVSMAEGVSERKSGAIDDEPASDDADEEEAGWETDENRVFPEPSEDLPPFSELSGRVRVLISFVIPGLAAVVCILLIWFGVI